jgi:hypothetical protein
MIGIAMTAVVGVDKLGDGIGEEERNSPAAAYPPAQP